MAELIGYSGPPGTLAEEAAMQYLTAGEKKAALQAFSSLPALFEAVAAEVVDEAVVPLENACDGAVSLTLDLLAGQGSLNIRDEIIMPVEHNLLARPDTTLSSVRKVVCHRQALAGCYNYLKKHLVRPELVEAESSAMAARLAAESPGYAAIGTARAASIFGLAILASAIDDRKGNMARFVVLGRGEVRRPAGKAKTSIMVSVTDGVGALYRILREFALRGLDLTGIKPRPAGGGPENCRFFIDLPGYRDDPQVAGALHAVGSQGAAVRVLGSYPARTAPECCLSTHEQKPTLEELRQDIDTIDRRIVELLARRSATVEAIARYKKDLGYYHDPVREEEVLEKVKEKARREGFDPEIVESIYKLLFPYYTRLQSVLDQN